MYKNIAIAALVCLCLFMAISLRTQRKNFEQAEISPAEYGGLIALRDIMDPDLYEKLVVSFMRTALSDGKITRAELGALQGILPPLGKGSLLAAQRPRAQDSLASLVKALPGAMPDAINDALGLSTELGKGLGEALGEFLRKMDEALGSKSR